MKILNNLDYNPNLTLILGFFDGMHKAHREVIKTAVDFAKQNNSKTALITFKQHPFSFIKNTQESCILSFEDRIARIEEQGVDYLYMLDFYKYYNLDSKEYLNEYIFKNFEPKAIVTGFNHTFGKNKSGNSGILGDFCQKNNCKYIEVEKVVEENFQISSSNIRNMLLNNQLERANSLLSCPFKISNKVDKGDGVAKSLGFKTANLKWPQGQIKLPYGVYCTEVKYNNKKYFSISNFGIRPSVDKEKKEFLEVHVFDFNEDIYDKKIDVIFHKKIRSEQVFKDKTTLIEQIQKDVEFAKVYFKLAQNYTC